MQISFTCILENDDAVNYVTNKVALHDVLKAFEFFLRCCGYEFIGKIDIVKSQLESQEYR
jgi:hypothetical protein